MRKSVVLTAAFILLFMITFTASAQDGKFGIGVLIGEPTGISAKLWLGQTSAVDGVVAWSFTNNPSVTIHADYLFHFFDVLTIEQGRIPLYVGIGGTVSIAPEPDIGVRIPFGATYLFDTAPLDIFLEVAPVFLLFPATTFDFSGGLGIRFYLPAKKRA